jgi:hypothetical protein
MTKRDYITEISAKRARLLKRAPRYDQLTKRVDALIEMADFVTHVPRRDAPFKVELTKYLPIGWVACIEGYSRLVFRDLIDHGSPFRENAAKFKDIRIGLEHVVAVQAGSVTLGEFIAHLLPANGIDDISGSMSVLLGEPFLDRLKAVRTDIFEPGASLEELELFGQVLESVSTLFEWRHIYAHELSSKARLPIRDVVFHTRAALILMSHMEVLVSECVGASA